MPQSIHSLSWLSLTAADVGLEQESLRHAGQSGPNR
jgi:hypothetical protein